MSESLITAVLAPLTFIFVFRYNVAWGIPDMLLIIFTDTVSSIVGQCLVFLPMSIIFAKICPKHIEATTFALLAGVSNFRGTISSWIGAWINDTFVGVSETDLSKYWILVLISYVCCFLPLFFLWLIPTRKQIEELQESMKNEEETATSKKHDTEDGTDENDKS
mmetsp:Transcript_30179/g.40115  ORF Transcript_30179/g.40115 Transcript_30179/m.40115 type:complete len:164 (+) Transcript_30179:1083-1574(+)